MTQAQKLADLSQAFTAGSLGFRNLLINATGRTNQRAYASGANVTGANTYTLDRWRVVTSGQNLGYAAGVGPCLTFTAPAGGVEQVVEGINILGGTYCLYWEGNATATVNGTTIAKGGSVVLPAFTDTVVRFIGGTFLQPQLEPGIIPTTFDLRPQWIEDLACRRYYEAIAAPTAFACNATTQVVGAGARFIVRKRTTPAVAVPSSISLQPGGITVVPSVAAIDTDAFSLVGIGSGLTVGFAYSGGLAQFTANAEL